MTNVLFAEDLDHPTVLMDIGTSFEVGEMTTPRAGEDVTIGARLTTYNIEGGTGRSRTPALSFPAPRWR